MDNHEKTGSDKEPDELAAIAQSHDPDTLCGIGGCKPKFLQPVAKMMFFVPVLGLSVLFSQALGIYFISQIITIEKQFGISSTESGLLLSANEIGFMATVLFWSHFARKMHKPRFLAACTVLFAIASAMCAIPHGIIMSEEGEIYNLETTSAVASQTMCRVTNETRGQTAASLATASQGLRRMAYVVVAVSMVIQGISKAPRSPLASTYIDDNVPQTRTGLYFGIMIGLAIFGPLLGSSFGGLFSRVYVTLEETSLSPRDPRFVGAWWLGFVVLSGLALVSAVPLVLFPRRMPLAPKNDAKEPRTETFKELLQDSYKSIWRLVTNPLLMVMVLCDGISMFTVSGRVSFFPKYLVEHFRVAPSQSSILLGATVLVGACIGSFLSGIVTTWAKLTIRGCLIVICVFETAGAIILLSGMAVKCEQTQLHGLTSPSEQLKLVAVPGNWSCSTTCHCTEADYLPSCGSDGQTYYSPCHAGCNASLQNRDFTNCACLPTVANRTVSPGACEEECEALTLYLVMAFVTAFIATLVSVPSTLTKLRSVDMKDRSLSIGASSFVVSALGFFLGPIVFGALIDSSCILWDRRGTEEGEKGYCALYDTEDIRFKMHVFTGGVRLCILALYLVSLVTVYKLDRYKELFEEQKNIYAAEKTKQLEKRKNKGQNSGGKAYTAIDNEKTNVDL